MAKIIFATGEIYEGVKMHQAIAVCHSFDLKGILKCAS